MKRAHLVPLVAHVLFGFFFKLHCENGLAEWGNGLCGRYFSRDILLFSSPWPPKSDRNGCGRVDLISPFQRGSLSVRCLLWKNERRKTCALFTTRLSTAAPSADKAVGCRKMDFSVEKPRKERDNWKKGLKTEEHWIKPDRH